MDSPTPVNARISIIGAGPGGLTCARILQQHGIPVTVYDRDPEVNSRNQGGSLDLHEEDGQLALREAGLLEEFFALARLESQEMRRMDPAGRVLAHHLPDAGETVSRDRPRTASRSPAGLARCRDGSVGTHARISERTGRRAANADIRRRDGR